MRLDRPKKAVIAPMSQMSSSEKPCSCSRAKSVSSTASGSRQSLSAMSSIAFWRGVASDLRWSIAIWSAISGFFSRMRRIAPCATTQYRQRFAPEVATTIISFSPLLRPEGRSISASW